jgi:hypothetical protein
MDALGRTLVLMPDLFWRVLERPEAGNEDVGKHEESFWAIIVFTEAAKDPRCHELTERSSCKVDVLPIVEVVLLVKKLGAVHK